MHPGALPPALILAAPAVSGRLGGILRALMALIASAFLTDPRRVALINPLWSYLSRTLQRFDRVMSRLAAGTLRPTPLRPAPLCPTPRSAAPRSGRAPSGTPAVRLPRTRLWLVVALRHNAASLAGQLDHLLNDPEAAAIIAATPQAQRLLRPLCHLLGIAPACLARTRHTRPPAAAAGAAKAELRAAPRTRRAPPDPDDAPAFSPRPRVELCPRLLTRWPFAPHPKQRPA